MRITTISYFLVSSLILTHATTSNIFNETNYGPGQVIIRDVAVIGGGSSGTYGAVNLHRLGQSVILIEKEDDLGGMINSYTDPTTGTTLDYGVQAFWNISATRDYFSYLDVPASNWAPDPRTNVYADFATGKDVDVNVSSNYTAYSAQLAKYPYLEYSWNLPDVVPEDLLLPFRDFIAKYDLVDIAYAIFFDSQGLSNILDQLTVNVFKIVDASFIDALHGGDVATAHHKNDEIFVAAKEKLGTDNLLLSSTVVCTRRLSGHNGVRLVVKTPTGNKLVKASKLLVSIPPLIDNMQPFDLDETETELFSKWQYSGYYTMLVNNTGLPDGLRYVNANAGSTANIPALPAPYQVTQTSVSGLFYIWYGSPTALTQEEVEKDTAAVIQRLAATHGANGSVSNPQFVEFRSHTPFKLVVSANEIRDGFYKTLEELQGLRNTWYTGAAFISHSSGILWNYTQAMLPDIIGS